MENLSLKIGADFVKHNMNTPPNVLAFSLSAAKCKPSSGMKEVAGTSHDEKLQGEGEARWENNVHNAEGRDRRMQNNVKRDPLALQFLVNGLDEGKD